MRPVQTTRTSSRVDKVRTTSGEVRTVWEQRGYQMFVVEETDNAWYHANILFRITSS